MKTGTKRETSILALAASSQDRLTPIVHRSRRSVQTICISHGGVSTWSALLYDGHLGNNTEDVTMKSCCIVIQVAGIVASPLPDDPPVTRRRTFNTRWPHRSGWSILGVHIVSSCEGVCALELSIGQQLNRCGVLHPSVLKRWSALGLDTLKCIRAASWSTEQPHFQRLWSTEFSYQ